MSTIIFDFDGTVADSLDLFVDVLHIIAGRQDRVSQEVIDELRGMSVRQAAKAVNFPLWRIPFISGRGFRLMRSRIAEVKPAAGVPGVIKKLQKQGYELYIMSTNSVDNIELFLRTHDMEGVFKHVYGDVRVFGKARALRRVIRRERFDRHDTVYVGDEVRDIEGAKHAGIRVVAVTWGYNTAEVLARHHPEAQVDTAEELLATLERMLQ